MVTRNPFKVGDKVKVKKTSFDFEPKLWDAYRGYEYSFVTAVDGNKITTSEDKSFGHHTHFELYKEEKDMTQQITPQTTPQTQPKTKRVPFTHELWERNQTAKVIWTPTETEILYFAKWGGCGYDYIGVYKAPGEEYAASAFVEGDFPDMAIEIPVTTKRIPFDPELKTAKVFTKDGNRSVVDWAMFKDGQVACQWPNQYMGYYPTNYLEMEIEEDV